MTDVLPLSLQKKFGGLKARPPPRTDLATSIFVVFGCFLSLLIISAGHKYGQSLQGKDYPFFLGSFGALSSLVFGAPQSPYAQPRMYVSPAFVLLFLAGMPFESYFHICTRGHSSG